MDAGFCNEITEYFKKQKLQPWFIGALRFQADQDYLKPHRFTFRTHTPPATRREDWPSILGMYVLTSTAQPPAHGTEPSWGDAWPVSADFDAVVYFSADLMWTNEVIPALHDLPNVTVKIDPDTHEYSGVMTEPTLVFDQAVEILDGWEGKRSSATRRYPHAKVALPGSAVTLRFGLSGLALRCDQRWTESFPY